MPEGGGLCFYHRRACEALPSSFWRFGTPQAPCVYCSVKRICTRLFTFRTANSASIAQVFLQRKHAVFPHAGRQHSCNARLINLLTQSESHPLSHDNTFSGCVGDNCLPALRCFFQRQFRQKILVRLCQRCAQQQVRARLPGAPQRFFTPPNLNLCMVAVL